MTVKSKLIGMKELDAKLAELGGVMETKVVRAGLRSAMKVAKDAAQSAAPVGDRTHRTYLGRLVAPGFASRNLRVIVGRPKNGALRAVLGVRKEAFYALQFIERGTARIPARPWLEPAFNSSKDAVLEKFRKILQQRVLKIARGRKGKK